MKRILSLFWIGLAFPSALSASPTHPKVAIGLDVGMPYLLTVDGATAKSRGNANLGFDGRYFFDEHVNLGGRFAFDVEKQGGSARQISFAPGVQYHWMTEDRFSPYVRFDVPWIIPVAKTNLLAGQQTGAGDEMDFGISGGGGLVWNLGGALGLPGGAIRYDFNFQYLFGVGSAVPVLAMELFKFGVEYRF